MAIRFQTPKTSPAEFAGYASEMLGSLKLIADDYEMTLLGNLIEFARIEAARNTQIALMETRTRKSRKAAA